MGGHKASLLTSIVVSVLFFALTLVFNALAGPGKYPFVLSTGNVSKLYETQITPSGWTFSIWGVIYAWLTAMFVYILSGLCRKNAYGYVYCSPPVLPHGFFAVWCTNMALNVAWLFLWDRRLMLVALFFLIMVAGTNYAMIFFSCHGLHIHGAWLNKYHSIDLRLFRVLIQNGLALYATWTTIATLINLTIVLNYEAGMSPTDAATLSLSVLTVVLLVWFSLENSVLDKHVRYILTIYPVVIVALSGNMTKNYDASAPGRNAIFIAALLALACTLFVVRVSLTVWKHVKQPLYQDVSPEDVSPMEVAEKQKKIFS